MMTIHNCLKMIREKGMKLIAEDGKLTYSAPKGAVDQTSLSFISNFRDVLLCLYSGDQRQIKAHYNEELKRFKCLERRILSCPNQDLALKQNLDEWVRSSDVLSALLNAIGTYNHEEAVAGFDLSAKTESWSLKERGANAK